MLVEGRIRELFELSTHHLVFSQQGRGEGEQEQEQEEEERRHLLSTTVVLY